MPPTGSTLSPLGAIKQTCLATDHQMEVCTLSCRSNHFISYPLHYKEAFAFSILLYLLRHQIILRSSLSATLARRHIRLTSFRISNRVGTVLPFRR